jgi:hypothetical protein
MMPSPRPRSTRQAQAGLQYAFGTVARANPIVAAWRWRYEIAAAAGLAAAWIGLGTVAGAAITVGLVTALISTAVHWPRGRRFLTAHAWRIVTPHRVRAGCAQAWIHSRDGKIPAVLLTTRQPFGERVYLWCRAGTSVEDLASARGLLAAACWADDIQVARSPRYAHLVTLDVIRRRRPGGQAGPERPGPVSAAGIPLAIPPPREPADHGARQASADELPRWPASASHETVNGPEGSLR